MLYPQHPQQHPAPAAQQHQPPQHFNVEVAQPGVTKCLPNQALWSTLLGVLSCGTFICYDLMVALPALKETYETAACFHPDAFSWSRVTATIYIKVSVTALDAVFTLLACVWVHNKRANAAFSVSGSLCCAVSAYLGATLVVATHHDVGFNKDKTVTFSTVYMAVIDAFVIIDICKYWTTMKHHKIWIWMSPCSHGLCMKSRNPAHRYSQGDDLAKSMCCVRGWSINPFASVVLPFFVYVAVLPSLITFVWILAGDTTRCPSVRIEVIH